MGLRLSLMLRATWRTVESNVSRLTRRISINAVYQICTHRGRVEHCCSQLSHVFWWSLYYSVWKVSFSDLIFLHMDFFLKYTFLQPTWKQGSIAKEKSELGWEVLQEVLPLTREPSFWTFRNLIQNVATIEQIPQTRQRAVTTQVTSTRRGPSMWHTTNALKYWLNKNHNSERVCHKGGNNDCFR